MTSPPLHRRHFLTAATVGSAASLLPGQTLASAAADPTSEEYQFEVTRSLPD